MPRRKRISNAVNLVDRASALVFEWLDSGKVKASALTPEQATSLMNFVAKHKRDDLDAEVEMNSLRRSFAELPDLPDLSKELHALRVECKRLSLENIELRDLFLSLRESAYSRRVRGRVRRSGFLFAAKLVTSFFVILRSCDEYRLGIRKNYITSRFICDVLKKHCNFTDLQLESLGNDYVRLESLYFLGRTPAEGMLVNGDLVEAGVLSED
jgi:hypothetical protein